jgi:hypothetical protein
VVVVVAMITLSTNDDNKVILWVSFISSDDRRSDRPSFVRGRTSGGSRYS